MSYSYGWKTLVYNQNNRMVRVEENGTTIAEYMYNGLEQRTAKAVGGTTTVFHYDFSGNILAESNTAGQFATEYLYSGSSRIAMAKPNENKYYFFQNDHLGTPRTVIDENNVVVWEAMWRPFGEALPHEASTIENYLRFSGQIEDRETGFHYNWHRYYDPSTGRYLEADPIRLAGGINLYAYAGANPVMMTDPEGLYITHAIMSREAFSKERCDKLADDAVNSAESVDMRPDSQQPWNSHWHGMRDGSDPTQSPKEAERKTENWISDNLAQCSAYGLGTALHAIQDINSGGHVGYQPWDGTGKRDHLINDVKGGNKQQAIMKSILLIRSFKKLCPCACVY